MNRDEMIDALLHSGWEVVFGRDLPDSLPEAWIEAARERDSRTNCPLASEHDVPFLRDQSSNPLHPGLFGDVPQSIHHNATWLDAGCVDTRSPIHHELRGAVRTIDDGIAECVERRRELQGTEHLGQHGFTHAPQALADRPKSCIPCVELRERFLDRSNNASLF